MSSFTIMVDTSCDLPPEIMAEQGIEVLPIPFDLDGTAHDGGYWQNITDKEFYDALRKGGVAKTSQINLGTFSDTFTVYAKEGKDLLYLALSSGLSGTYDNAKTALQMVKETYPECGVCAVDSLSATNGMGLFALLAVKKREEGLTAKETAAWLEEKRDNCLGFFTVDDLMYLYRGGRLSRLSAVAGSIFGVKPVLNLAPDGTLALKDKVRGRKAAMELMVTQFKRSLNPGAALDTVLIAHTDCREDADTLAEMVKAAAHIDRVLVMMMGPVIGAHLGPGAVTLIFEAGMTRQEYEDKFYK